MNGSSSNAPPLRESITSALRYWELRRIAYNAVLVATVLCLFAIGYPTSKRILTVDSLVVFFVLAVLANVAYCAAYIPDVLIQQSSFRDSWLRLRWVLLVIGTSLAVAVTYLLTAGMLGVGAGANANW